MEGNVKSLLAVMLVGTLLGTTGFVGRADAAEKGHGGHHGKARVKVSKVHHGDRGVRGRDASRFRRGDDRDFRRRDARDFRGRDDRYFRGRDVVVIRDYYRPYYRPVPPGLRARYVRGGHLPPGWARRVRPVPRRFERDLVVVPRGYHRGVIDGYAVVYNDRGFILDLAFLF
jgi:hypothetical protein